MKQLYCLIFVLSTSIFAQKVQSFNSQESANKPTLSSAGIIMTDSYSSGIYLQKDSKTELLVSSPGSGQYFTFSKAQQKIGFKYIDAEGNQIPALVDPLTKEITYLHDPTKAAGQVSFADDGTIAFTVGNELFIKSGGGEKKFDLGNYSNLAPISPNANFAAYNNNSDQLLIINLFSGTKLKITDNLSGYFNPIWSPDGNKILYSSLSGKLKVYDLVKKVTYSLGEGYSPSWSNSSQYIVFYKKEIQKLQVVNSDIYIVNYNGNNLHSITSTSDKLEIDPSFTSNDSGIVYSFMNNSGIMESKFSSQNYELKDQVEIQTNIPSKTGAKINSYEQTQDVDTLNIPYINQVYDTPDYFNGSAACGPTSAMMVLAYYNILPAWTIQCSWPSHHNSSWGQYISDSYRFRQVTYTYKAEDPNGREAEGAYGYMWCGSSHPYSSMAAFFKNHGINATRIDTPSYEMADYEVSLGHPYVICNGLTSAGHIIVAHGTASQNRVLIFNDPYGNKNLGTYPNYSGKNVKYDWPGYNNGYQNLNEVYWAVSINYNNQSASDTLIDDLDFAKGFYLNNQSPASMNTWKDLNQGYDGHMWFVFTTSLSNQDTCFVTWTPNLPKSGYYNVSAYIPYSEAEDAEYKVYSTGGLETVSINQLQYKNSWVSLGTFKFDQGSSGYVKLGNGSNVRGEAIIFDAMKWTYIDSVSNTTGGLTQNTLFKYQLDQNYPNPFNPTTKISYTVPSDLISSKVILNVYNVLGKQIERLVNENQKPGNYNLTFNAANLPSGIYFYRLEIGNLVQTKKMILLK